MYVCERESVKKQKKNGREKRKIKEERKTGGGQFAPEVTGFPELRTRSTAMLLCHTMEQSIGNDQVPSFLLLGHFILLLLFFFLSLFFGRSFFF